MDRGRIWTPEREGSSSGPATTVGRPRSRGRSSRCSSCCSVALVSLVLDFYYRSNKPGRTLAVLDERYARGELTRAPTCRPAPISAARLLPRARRRPRSHRRRGESDTPPRNGELVHRAQPGPGQHDREHDRVHPAPAAIRSPGRRGCDRRGEREPERHQPERAEVVEADDPREQVGRGRAPSASSPRSPRRTRRRSRGAATARRRAVPGG